MKILRVHLGSLDRKALFQFRNKAVIIHGDTRYAYLVNLSTSLFSNKQKKNTQADNEIKTRFFLKVELLHIQKE